MILAELEDGESDVNGLTEMNHLVMQRHRGKIIAICNTMLECRTVNKFTHSLRTRYKLQFNTFSQRFHGFACKVIM